MKVDVTLSVDGALSNFIKSVTDTCGVRKSVGGGGGISIIKTLLLFVLSIRRSLTS